MEHVIRKAVEKKLRKRGKEYRLTENSKMANQDFGYVNKIASKIYRLCKGICPEMLDRGVYQQLIRKVMESVRSDETHELGDLRIGHGPIQSLRHFQLNSKRSWSGYLPFAAKVTCDLEKGQVKIVIPSSSDWLPKKYDPRVSKLSIRFHLLKIPFEWTQEAGVLSTQELLIEPASQTRAKTALLRIDGWDNCALIIVGTVNTYFWEKNDQTRDYITGNKNFFAAEFIEVFGLREGTLIEAPSPAPPTASNTVQDEGASWH